MSVRERVRERIRVSESDRKCERLTESERE